MRAGTGHLEKIGETWFLRYRVGFGRRSKQKRVRLGTSAQIRSGRAARDAADVWLEAQSPQSLKPGPGIRASAYFRHYQATHIALMRPASQRRYASALRAHLRPRFGRLKLEEMDAIAIQQWIADLAPTLARESVRGLRAILLQILRQAVADGYAAHRLDSRAIRLPKSTRAPRERREINDIELAAILEASAQPWRLLWALMGYAGLRIGEALGLEGHHIDRRTRLITVSQQAVAGLIQPTKTETSRKAIPIGPELAAELDRAAAPVAGQLLFQSRRGTPLRSDNVRARELHPLLEELGIRRAGCHAFRHGLPGRLFAIGASPPVVQRCMRHGSLRQTETYLHTGNLDLHAALDRVRNSPG